MAPRNVRNFWLDLNVDKGDGTATNTGVGPVAKDGGFRCRVLMRSDGQIYSEDLMVDGIVIDGLLELRVWDGGRMIFKRTTKR